MALIHQKIADVMRDVSAVTKTRTNSAQKYQFRGIDDVYNHLHAPMAKHGVFSLPEVLDDRTEDRKSGSGGTLIYRVLKIRFHFFCEDGSSVSCVVIGEGMDSGDKASNKAMAVAHKYALLQVFSIPTEEQKDPEYDSHTIAGATPYRSDPEQKREVKRMLDKYGVTTAEEQILFAKEFYGVDMAALPIAIKEFKERKSHVSQ